MKTRDVIVVVLLYFNWKKISKRREWCVLGNICKYAEYSGKVQLVCVYVVKNMSLSVSFRDDDPRPSLSSCISTSLEGHREHRRRHRRRR